MIDFDKKIEALEENSKNTKVDYTYTIERIDILKTLAFVYDKLNEEEAAKLDELINEEIEAAIDVDNIRHGFRKSVENGNGLINYQNDIDKRTAKVAQKHAVLENYLFNEINVKYSNDGSQRS